MIVNNLLTIDNGYIDLSKVTNIKFYYKQVLFVSENKNIFINKEYSKNRIKDARKILKNIKKYYPEELI